MKKGVGSNEKVLKKYQLAPNKTRQLEVFPRMLKKDANHRGWEFLGQQLAGWPQDATEVV